jgi:general stress protein 26
MARKQTPAQELAELLEEIDIAMLTTVGPDGYLVSRPLSTQAASFDGEFLWFFTAT